MVTRKKSRISKKPTTPVPDPDNWVQQGGTDPEVVPVATPSLTPTPAPEVKDKKTFPHRISFDMDTPQYKRLKYAAFDSNRTMNEILREAVEDWMISRDY